MATKIVRYVNTDWGSSSGDGSYENPWDSMQTAYNAIHAEYGGNLTGAQVQVDVHLAGTSPDKSMTANSELIQNEECYLHFIGNWDGKGWNTTQYRIETTGSRAIMMGAASYNYTRFTRIQAKVSNIANADTYGFNVNITSGGGRVIFTDCLVDMRLCTQPRARAFSLTNSTGHILAINCVAINSDQSTDSVGFRRAGSGGTVHLLNCTSVGGSRPFYCETGDMIVRNCGAVGGSVADFAGTFKAESGWNASSDATAPGANAQHNVTPIFRDTENLDYRLAEGDTAWRDKGVDLSTYSHAGLIAAVTTDIAGYPRNAVANAYDIGAGEVQIVATPTLVIDKPVERQLHYRVTLSNGGDISGVSVGPIEYISGSGWIAHAGITVHPETPTVGYLTIITWDENVTGIAPGTYVARVPILFEGATNSGDAVEVTYTVTE